MSNRDPRFGDNGTGTGTGIVTRTKPKTRKPSMYKVLLLNDDFTPMEFVVQVLERFFNKSREDATRIMLDVHQNGIGVCGIYTFEVRRNKSDPGDRHGTQTSASSSVHDGKGIGTPLPAFSKSLEDALRQALQLATDRHQQFATLEHLLLALTDDQDAAAVMRACNVEIDVLKEALTAFIDDTELDDLISTESRRSGADNGVPKGGCSARSMHVQSSGRAEVTGANVLVAIFAERESHAAFFLQEQDMTRYDAVNYISHGVAKRPGVRAIPPTARLR